MSVPVDHPRRCQAHSSQTGAPCKKWALVGQRVCRAHGGASPQAKARAEWRLARLAEGPAIDALERALKSGDWGATVRAAKDLLDRAERRQQSYSPAVVQALVRELVTLALSACRTDDERRRVAFAVRRLASGTFDVPALPSVELPSASNDDAVIYVDEVLP